MSLQARPQSWEGRVYTSQRYLGLKVSSHSQMGKQDREQVSFGSWVSIHQKF